MLIDLLHAHAIVRRTVSCRPSVGKVIGKFVSDGLTYMVSFGYGIEFYTVINL